MTNESTWYDTHQLIHYTKSPEIVASILRLGFLLVPNKRHLIQQLLGTGKFMVREPQEFGMVSFTELEKERAPRHREAFGDFGIAVSWEWAVRHGAQRVIYVGAGPILEALSWLFQLAKQELERRSPEPPTEFILGNKAVAGMYGQMFAHLLTLYEFMEPERNSSQVEWRVVNQLPFYHEATTRSELVRKLLEMAEHGLGICTVPVKPEDVVMLLCPASEARSLRKTLPKGFSDVSIVPYAKFSSLEGFGRFFLAHAKALAHRREKVVYREIPLPKNVIVLQETKKYSGVYALPPISEMKGLLAYPDDVLDRASFNAQYKSFDGNWFELRMPITESLTLLHYLSQMTRNPRFSLLIELAQKRIRDANIESPEPKK